MSHLPDSSGVGLQGNIRKLLTCCPAPGLPLRQGGHLTRAASPLSQAFRAAREGLGRGSGEGPGSRPTTQGPVGNPAFYPGLWAEGRTRPGPAGLRDQKLLLSHHPVPGVVQPESLSKDPLSRTSVNRKPPGWSGSPSRGAAWSSETLKDTTEAKLARDSSRSFIGHLSLRICTLVTHRLPPGALQAF